MRTVEILLTTCQEVRSRALARALESIDASIELSAVCATEELIPTSATLPMISNASRQRAPTDRYPFVIVLPIRQTQTRYQSSLNEPGMRRPCKFSMK